MDYEPCLVCRLFLVRFYKIHPVLSTYSGGAVRKCRLTLEGSMFSDPFILIVSFERLTHLSTVGLRFDLSLKDVKPFDQQTYISYSY